MPEFDFVRITVPNVRVSSAGDRPDSTAVSGPQPVKSSPFFCLRAAPPHCDADNALFNNGDFLLDFTYDDTTYSADIQKGLASGG